jgi:hypothetical protein
MTQPEMMNDKKVKFGKRKWINFMTQLEKNTINMWFIYFRDFQECVWHLHFFLFSSLFLFSDKKMALSQICFFSNRNIFYKWFLRTESFYGYDYFIVKLVKRFVNMYLSIKVLILSVKEDGLKLFESCSPSPFVEIIVTINVH